MARRLLRVLGAALMRVHRACLKKPKATLFLAFMIWLLASAGLSSGFDLIVAVEDLLDPGSPGRETVEELKGHFRTGNTIQVILHPEPGSFSMGEVCAVRRWMSAVRAFHPKIVRVRSSFDLVRAPKPEPEKLRYETLLKLDCDLEGEKLEAQNAEFSRRFAILRRASYAPWMASRAPFPPDLVVEFDYERPAGERFDPNVVLSVQKSFQEKVLALHPELKAEWTGEALFQLALFEGNRQVSTLNGWVMLFLVLGIRWISGKWRMGLLFAVSLAWMGGVVFGLMAFLKVPFDPLAASVFLMVTVASLEDFIFLVWPVLTRELRPSQWRGSFRRLMIPGFLTSVSTVIGFLSLSVAKQGMIRRFGLWCGIGAILEWAFMFLVIPSWLRVFPSFRVLADQARSPAYRLVTRLSERSFPAWLARASLLIFPLAFVSLHHLRVSDAPMEFFSQKHPIRRAVAYLKKTRGWEAPVFVVFKKYDNEAANREVLTRIAKHPAVVAIESPWQWLDELTAGHPDLTRDMIRREVTLSPFFKQMVTEQGWAKATVYVGATDLETIHSVSRAIAEACASHDCEAAGSFVAYSELIDQVPGTLLESFVVSLILVSLILVWLCFGTGAGRVTIAVLLSSLWGPAALFFLIPIFGIPANLVTCTFAAVMVGVAGDNAVQFLLGDGTKAPRDVQGRLGLRAGASLLCATAMGTTSLLFLFSYFEPHHTFGVLLCAGMGFLILGDVFVLRGLLQRPSS